MQQRPADIASPVTNRMLPPQAAADEAPELKEIFAEVPIHRRAGR